MSGHRPTCAETRAVACPVCFALGGEPCASVGKVRRVLKHHHAERVARYRDGLFGPTVEVPSSGRERTPPATPAPGYGSLPPGWRPDRRRAS